MTRHNIIALSRLKPTQITVGLLQVKHKRKVIKALSKRPAELLDFILEHPIRVVLGPRGNAYVIDHHHLALALIKEHYQTAPMEVEKDLSAYTSKNFWKEMQRLNFVHAVDGNGRKKALSHIPGNLKKLEDDPYRSLAGFTREAGGFMKVQRPYAEFLWADFFRSRIKEKLISKNFNKALKQALVLARHKEARGLPGQLKPVA